MCCVPVLGLLLRLRVLLDCAEVCRLRGTVQKRGCEELRFAQGQGQQPRAPGCDSSGVAERSYPTSEVKNGGQEELPHA